MMSRKPVGHIVPRIETADIARMLDAIFAAAPERRHVAFGTAACAMAFASAAHADAYCSALLPAPEADEPTTLSLAVMHGDAGVLASFIPRDAGEYAFASDGRVSLAWMPRPSPCLSLYDHAARRGVQWAPEERIAAEFLARPCLFLLHAYFADTEWVPLHAAAIGRDGQFLLLCGPSRSGKTTAALACAMHGWTYAGDDIVLVNPKRRLVAPLYVSARLRPESQSALRGLMARTLVGHSDEDGDPRAELRLRPGMPGIAVGGGRIAAILLPQRGGSAEVVFRKAGAAEAAAAVIPASTLQLPGFRGPLFAKLLATLNAAPRFAVDTGSEPGRIPSAFQHMLEDL